MPTSDIDHIDDLLSLAAQQRSPVLEGSVHLHATDVDGEWLLQDGSDGTLVVLREHAKGDVAARGPAAQLRALLSGAGDGPAVEVFGDRSVLDRLVERTTSNS